MADVHEVQEANDKSKFHSNQVILFRLFFLPNKAGSI